MENHLLPIHQVNKKNRPTLDFICEQIAASCDVTPTQLRSRDRTTGMVNIRCVFVLVATIYRYSAAEVSFFLSKRDHSSVCHALTCFIDFFNTNDEAIMRIVTQVQTIFPYVPIKPFRNHEYQD
jgi:chromosomal replication initiation ATPase DnaA